ncbi:3-hydroxyacyl-[acyl-carrier-protein] dehydratase [Prauserella isguenensis]|uniref:3-hydroxyacyl-[acyl-carrier-protein] dehydratase n=1 Tax=Prauserella isguenensis TaxID=1470180 RepID=A0A839S3W1_9PSEU|nr:3-hydroxyacyl-ACP dehydratase FabZ [Prauserella isguenensis]MBB3052448.1 3-hydroxyacyl-[acyl-carrier-protein] dehydratase [Prauserella isguenensis]
MSETPASPEALTDLGHERIREILPHRWPMLMIDRVDRVEPGLRATGVKNVSATEPWFQGHFPDEAVLPGVLVTEALAQLSGVVFALAGAGPIGYLAGVRSMRFRRPVRPGDSLRLSTERSAGGRGFCEYKVSARVDGSVVAEGSITVADPSATNGKV